ncbi:hypothetical protein [Flavobacterium undicola]|uniref:hypothetical protein n=1 Tax=Flavobacterium undicola TaxID=1932779 RepID=UPI001378248F|nr:hypothetical protein [Flavobacterium undicola]MBA0882149.1 hypothetical protein [Flavobacterium undicola]
MKNMSRSKLVILVIFFSLVIKNGLYAQAPGIFITPVRNGDNSVDFKYTKEGIGSFIVDIHFTKLENSETTSIPNMNVTSNSGLLFKLKPLDKNKKIDFFYSYTVTQGYLNPTLDSTVTYMLPFKKGKKVKIYWGTRPGISPEKWKKYVVNSNNQDSVFGMRKGVVVDVRTLTVFNKDEVTQETKKVLRKEIIVEHADGTFASYSGIEENSIAVKIGQTINPQSYIGVMDELNGGRYSFTFDIYYHEPDQMNYRGNLISVSPNFLTQNGVEKLESKKEYVVTYDESILLK